MSRSSRLDCRWRLLVLAGMPEPAPFQVTPEARVWIRRVLRPAPGVEPDLILWPPLEMEAALILAFGFDERDGRGGSSAKFEGEHFMIAFNSIGKREQCLGLICAGPAS
jgi:hypothetical protein